MASWEGMNSQRNRTEYSRNRYAQVSFDGNAARRMSAVPERRPEIERRRQQKNVQRVRERALSVTMSYVAFLMMVSAATVFVCINFLRLQADGIELREQIAVLESRLSSLQIANNNAYEDTISAIDMNTVKNIAVNELGMTYADEGQVITYNGTEGDYILQYAEIPEG